MTGPTSDELRERTREQILVAMGGWSGTVVAAVPPVVFVIVNVLTTLRTAIIAAIATGLLIACYRAARHQPLQQVASGLFGVLLAALIAARTGQARGYFLLGIAGSVLYGAAFAVSLIVRRPLVGLLWEFLDPSPLPEGTKWYRVPVLQRAYDVASLLALAMFGSRAIVQASLFQQNRTGWLAVARIAMGFPLYAAVVALVLWVVRRARHRLPALPVPTDLPAGTVLDEVALDDGALNVGEVAAASSDSRPTASAPAETDGAAEH